MNDICKVCYETIKTGEAKCSNCGAEVIREVASLSKLLRACPVCTTKVSSMALSCPCCGHPIRPPQTQTDANVIVTGFKVTFRNVFDIVQKTLIATLILGICVWGLLHLLGAFLKGFLGL